MKLEDLLIDSREVIQKLAQELPQKQQYEQDFGNLAFVFFKDRASDLIDDLIGFEVLEMSDDGDKGVGVFGVNIHDKIFLVPVFFLEGQIKGMLSLYDPEKDFMYPLTENWVNYLQGKETLTLGDQAQGVKVEDFLAPDFQYIKRIPGSYGTINQLGIKAGEDNTKHWKDTVDTLEEFYKHSQQQQSKIDQFKEIVASIKPEKIVSKLAETQEEIANQIASILEKKAYYTDQTINKQTLLKDAFYYIGPKKTSQFIKQAFESNKKYAEALLTFYDLDDIKSIFTSDYKPRVQFKKAETTKEPKLQIIRKDAVNAEKLAELQLSPQEQIRLAATGILIKDARDDNEKGSVHEVSSLAIENPTQPGIYPVYMANGEIEELAIAFVPYSRNAIQDKWEELDRDRDGIKNVIVFDPNKPNRYIETSSNKVFIAKDKPVKELKTIGKEVTADTKFGDENNRSVKYLLINNDGMGETVSSYDNIYVTASKSKYVRRIGDQAVIPLGHYRYIKLGTYKDEERLKLADKEAIDYMFHDSKLELISVNYNPTAEVVEVAKAASVYPEKQGDYADVLEHLVCEYGLDPKHAENVIAKAQQEQSYTFICKKAQSIYQLPQETSMYAGGLPVNGQVPQQQLITTPSPEMAQPGGGEIPPDVMNMAQQAAETGQKNVFDAGSLAMLSNLYNVGDMIDSFVPALMEALDKLGKIIFLFYWKGEEFKERYGDKDLPELEDKLKEVYRTYGDLVLKLKEQAVDEDMPLEV